jgi:hypothetical protein
MKHHYPYLLFLFIGLLMTTACKKKEQEVVTLVQVKAGAIVLSTGKTTTDIPVNSSFTIDFSNLIDPLSGSNGISLRKSDNTVVLCNMTFQNDNKTVLLTPQAPLANYTNYTLTLSAEIKGQNGEVFDGASISFVTILGQMVIENITVNQQDFKLPNKPRNIDYKNTTIVVRFSDALDPANYQPLISLFPNVPFTYSLSEDKKTVSLTNNAPLSHFSRSYFTISNALTSINGATFGGFANSFLTALDSTPKFPLISDDQLLTLIQEKAFRYFYDFAHPACGLARERNNSGDIVTIGGSGFGVMALIVGMERGMITRDQGRARMTKILGFLETCDRFHGAWPHWLNGSTGKTIAFSTNDNGADLVETSFMVQGLITMRQYLDPSVPAEQNLIERINALTNAVEYDWFTRGQNVLYWHWSPDKGWIMNMQIRGYNETLITYLAAATSSSHPIDAAVYHQGYAKSGGIKNGNTYYGYKLPLGEPYGGPLFFTHYSFLGLDPRTLQDQYANYWEQNVNHAMINWSYCYTNPKNYYGYSKSCWGLTASDNNKGYNAHSPTNDLGVISPTAAISSLPYCPEQSMDAIRFFYYTVGDRLWGEFGCYDAFNPSESWWANSTLAIDQGPMIIMIENYRSGLLWDLFMSAPDVQSGLTKLGFTY